MHVGACRCTCRWLEGKNRERGRKEKEGSSPATRSSPWQPNQNPPPCTFHHKADIHLYCHSKMKWCPSGLPLHHMCKTAAQLKLNFTPILERIRDTRSLNLHLTSFVFYGYMPAWPRWASFQTYCNRSRIIRKSRVSKLGYEHLFLRHLLLVLIIISPILVKIFGCKNKTEGRVKILFKSRQAFLFCHIQIASASDTYK